MRARIVERDVPRERDVVMLYISRHVAHQNRQGQGEGGEKREQELLSRDDEPDAIGPQKSDQHCGYKRERSVFGEHSQGHDDAQHRETQRGKSAFQRDDGQIDRDRHKKIGDRVVSNSPPTCKCVSGKKQIAPKADRVSPDTRTAGISLSLVTVPKPGNAVKAADELQQL